MLFRSLTKETAEDEAAQAEMKRFMEAQKARRPRAMSFHIQEEGEEEDDYLCGERPTDYDEGAVYDGGDEEDAETLGRSGDEDSFTRGNPKSFFPSTKPKAKATLPSGKGKLPREDVGATFPNGKLVDE